MRGEILLILSQGDKGQDILATLPVKPCGQETDYSC